MITKIIIEGDTIYYIDNGEKRYLGLFENRLHIAADEHGLFMTLEEKQTLNDPEKND